MYPKEKMTELYQIFQCIFYPWGEIELALEYNQMALNLNGPNQKLIRAIREEIFRITEK
ncbi:MULTISPECIES: hypothetical protein [Leptospira]|uniref:Uncharacterized protein n=2 Tax=Leptospira interrogans TaxID=173 RepID=M6K9W4_LEPIR|nr:MULTISPECIES: hypothetical protein [Leptospira]EKO04899.1 hypothetical protein LEP1GSC077_0030 [Leptospira interrogans str. C10069]EMN28570.1 hypothetical protein LEP1GSC083_0058 [Leptospira interrogans serovar Pyrogenes str. L0374]EMN64549.1 hypothetical protein LEP1GSC092_0088 [Leptospira interrogans serovar Pyrogenes str. R168]EMN79717.1 hypothetical protein LEP1GSC106_0548 [Leptospira interrogans serovar Grippotyphosa str. UI 12764]